MLNNFIQTLNSVVFETSLLFITFALISFYWKNIFIFLSLKKYKSKQRLHQNEIPRIAGPIIYIFLIIVALFSIDSRYLNVILFSALPIVLIGTKEDLFHNTSPKLRLIIMTFSSGLFIIYYQHHFLKLIIL